MSAAQNAHSGQSSGVARAVGRMSAQRGRDHRYRHPRCMQVGPLLRSQRPQCAEPGLQRPSCAQRRQSVPSGNAAKTLCNNEGHDLLLSQARSARVIRKRVTCTAARRITPAGRPVPERSGGRGDAGTGSGQDGFQIGTITRTGLAHLALTSLRPGHTRVSSHSPERKRYERPAPKRPRHPSRRSFGTARRIRNIVQKPLGLNPWSREELS